MTVATRFAPALVVLAVFALAGCAPAAPTPSASPTAENSSSDGCAQVTVVVDFGPLDEPSVAACAEAGVAKQILADAGVTTEGTADYGDQVVCRVNERPSASETVTIEGQAPFIESCLTLNAAAYWALWVKPTADAEWEYAQEGVSTLALTDGQSVGLVYTPGTESTPPEG